MINLSSRSGTREENRRSGFTLVELAIVLAVAGLLFVGLWRLLSSGNQQVRDQSAASQQQQLISSVKGFLASPAGQSFLTAMGPGTTAAGITTLPLPSTAANAAGNATCATDANMTGAIPTSAATFCNFLTAGTWAGTPNAYGQLYHIRVLKDSAAAGTPPNTYSFVIMTSGGDTIPDTSGGRISAFIGSDGGFIYSNPVCNAQTGTGTAASACGAYGTWAINVNNYGAWPTAAASGTIATRTYVSPTASNTFPWLARPLMPGDPPATPLWNTMQTDFFLGANTTTAIPNNFWLGINNNPAATGGGAINMQGGTINIEGGTITGVGSSNINMVNTTAAPATNPQIFVSSGCSQTTPGIPAGCPYSILVTGDESVSNLLSANALYAQTFIYQASDARLKTNVHPIADPLDDMMKLKPVSFTLKANGKESFGVIAQDLEKVYPQLVTQGEGMKSVNYDGLIGPLIGAVQELKQQNDDLRQQIRDQQKREDKLEKEIRDRKAE